MKIPFFGDVDIESLQNCYRIEIDFNGRKLDLDLNFESSSLDKDKLNLIIKILENLKEWSEKTKEFIKKEFQTGSEVDDYIEFHLEELFEEDLEKLLKTADKEITQKEQLLSVLKLERIGFYPEDTRHYAIFDFVTDREISDNLLVVKLNEKGELDLITMES